MTRAVQRRIWRAVVREESRSIALEIIACLTAPELVYAHRWQPGDLVLHDNSSTPHSTTEYIYRDEVRLMHRVIAYRAKYNALTVKQVADAS